MGRQTGRFYKVTHWIIAQPVLTWREDPEWMLVKARSAREAIMKMRAYIIAHPENFEGDINGFMAWCKRLKRKPNISMEREYFETMFSWRKTYPREIRYRHLVEAEVFGKIII